MMPNVIDGTARCAPRREQTRDRALSARVVADAPTRFIKGLLNVDNDQSRRLGKFLELHQNLGSSFSHRDDRPLECRTLADRGESPCPRDGTRSKVLTALRSPSPIA